MDPAAYGLIGTLLGGLVVSLGTWLNNYFTSKREEKQWERQQEAEKEKFKREDDKAKEEQLAERKEKISLIYQNCIHYLSLLVAEESEVETYKITGDKRIQAIEEAQRWLALLALRVGDELQFDHHFGRFTGNPDNNASRLREKVIELAAQDEELPLHSRQKQKPPVIEPEKPKEDEIQFQLSVDKEFRKEQLIDAIKVPSSYSFTLKLEVLTKEQRKVLADMYFDSNQRIPASVKLTLPLINPQNPKQLYLVSNRNWMIKFDPRKVQDEEILELWRKEYVEELEKLQKAL